MEKSAFFNSKLLPYLLLVPQLVVTFVFFYWARQPGTLAIVPARGCVRVILGIHRAGEYYQALFADPQYYKAMLTTVWCLDAGRGAVAVDRVCLLPPRPDRI